MVVELGPEAGEELEDADGRRSPTIIISVVMSPAPEEAMADRTARRNGRGLVPLRRFSKV